jgi:YD repeat-containing protein
MTPAWRVPFLRVFCLIVGLILVITPGVTRGAKLPPQQLAEQMYNYLKDRYVIRHYAYDPSPGGWQVTFTLDNGQQLTYDDSGRLLKKLLPDGSLIQYLHGYPVRYFSADGELLDRTDYLFTPQGRIKRALRFHGKNLTASFYDPEGNVHFEIQQEPRGLSYRYDFRWGQNRRYYSYLETRSWDGMTDYYRVGTASGLMLEHYRVSGGMKPVWDERYGLVLRLLLEKVRQDYSDRKRLKADSYGQTRGDVLLKYIRPEAFYPESRFISDYRRQRVVIDEEWKYIECTDIDIYLPWIDLVEEERVLVQRVKIEGDKVFTWVPERRRWERYPFDPEEEELIPLNMRGDAKIKARYARTFWRVDPEKLAKLQYTARLLVPPQALQEQRLQLSQHQNDEPDFDDLYRLLQASAENPRRPTPTPPREGESLTRLEPEQVRQLQYEVAYQVKRDLLLSPQTGQRDSDQRPQFDLLLRSLTPEQMLPLPSLASHLGNVRRLRSEAVDQLLYSELEVFLPQVDKEKSYTWINRVERGVRGLRVWQADPEHPDQGYWMPYALRPGRDEVLTRNGAWQLRVDEGRFRWRLLPGSKSRRVSGTVLWMRHPQKLAPRTLAQAAVLPSPQHTPARPRQWWLGLLGLPLESLLGGGSTEREIRRWQTPAGYDVHLLRRSWWGKTLGYRRIWKSKGGILQTEKYGPDGRLLEWQTARGETGLVQRVSLDRTRMEVQFNGQKQVWNLSRGFMEAMMLPDGRRLFFSRNQGQTRVQYMDARGLWQLARAYDQQGRSVRLWFPSGEAVEYDYLPGPEGGVELTFKQGERAQGKIKLNAKGQVQARSGNPRQMNILVRHLPFLLPERLDLPLITLQLKLE